MVFRPTCVLVLLVVRLFSVFRVRRGMSRKSMRVRTRRSGAPRPRRRCRTGLGTHALRRAPRRRSAWPERRAPAPQALPHGPGHARSMAHAERPCWRPRTGRLPALELGAQLAPAVGQVLEPNGNRSFACCSSASLAQLCFLCFLHHMRGRATEQPFHSLFVCCCF